MSTLLGAQVVEPGAPRANPAVKSVERAPSERFALGSAPVATLGGIDESLRDAPSPKRGVLRVGIERAVSARVLTQGAWQTAGDGSSVWRLALQSTDAVALRVHFSNFNVSDGLLWVHDPANKQSFGPYTGRGRFMDGNVWSGAVFGDTIEIEYKPSGPTVAASRVLPFAVQLVHLFRAGAQEAPRRATPTPEAPGREGAFLLGPPSDPVIPAAASEITTQASSIPSCLLDAACFTADATHPEVALVNAATAYLLFSDNGSQFQCSGTMINAPNGAPILLTAGHCISTTENAQSLTAAFGYINGGCNGTAPNPSAVPQVSGERILSFENAAFIDDSTLAAVTGNIDYSLVLMSGLPNAPGFTLAGYSATEIPFGTNVTSLSYPGGYPLRFAYGPRVDSTLGTDPNSGYWANAYQIQYNTEGRTDSGSSGSGIFDSGGHLLGTLSTGVLDCSNPDANGNCPAGSNACSVPGAYDTWYQKFGPVYALVNEYLEQPIQAPPSTNPAVFSASPNPVTGTNGLGSVTLTYSAPSGVTSTEIHVGSPDGVLMARDGPTGTATAPGWVTNGMQFYLQDTTSGKALTAANTLAIVTVTVIAQESAGSGSSNPSVFSANPNPIYSITGLGSTTLTFNAPSGVTSTEIHVGSPNGGLLAQGGPTGTATATGWVTDGMQFFLQDTTNGKPLNSANTLAVVTASLTTKSTSTLTANPSTIVNPNGTDLGQTTLTWSAPSASLIQIRIGSPTGGLFAEAGNTGSGTTGEWVTDGMTFYLLDVSNGTPASAQNVIATTTVRVTPSGGSNIGPGTAAIYLNPNPIIVSPGQTFATSTVYWNSGGVSPIQIHVGSATGALMAQAGAVGSATATEWVAEGTQFFLVDPATGNTLGSTTAHLTTNPVGLGNTTFTINNPITGSNGVGTAVLTWNTGVSSNVEIHMSGPSGPLVVAGGSQGSAAITGVPNGTVFYLQDVSYSINYSMYAAPNPIVSSTGVGTTSLNWDVSNSTTPSSPNGVKSVEIHLGSPSGTLFAGGGTTGTAVAGGWASNGMQFFLQDTSNGNPLVSANTLSIVTVTVTNNPNAPAVNSFNVNPLTLRYTLATVTAQVQ